MAAGEEDLRNIPIGEIGIIALPGCEELAWKISDYLYDKRSKVDDENIGKICFDGFVKENYCIPVSIERFGTGEAKAVLTQSVRGLDLYIICDMFNYGVTFKMYEKDVMMCPDAHFANLVRVISAIGGKARKVTIIMPMLYEGRQHKRSGRESLDCATSLQQLCNFMKVDNIITFDAHDSRVQNAIPLSGFENVMPVYQMIKALANNVSDLKIDKENLIIISPDEGAMSRSIYYSTVLGVDLGMFYKRRDYAVIVNGRHPIIAHEFLGDKVDVKDCVVVDDMISSGDSTLEVAMKLKSMNAKRIFVCVGFGLFCNGLEKFDRAYEAGLFDKVFTTNLIYRSPELLAREWYCEVDLAKYIALIVDTLNHEDSVGCLLDPVDRIDKFLFSRGFKQPAGS